MKKYATSLLLAGAMVLGFAAFAAAQTPITPEQRKQANEFYTARNWSRSAEVYDAIAKAEPQNAGALMRLGTALHNLKNYDQAMDAYLRSEKINGNPTTRYNIACIYSIKNDREKAFEWLDKAIDAGFINLATLRSDTDLANLRENPRFKVLEEKMDRIARPCAYSADARNFDFWVGDWDVKTQQGQNAGANRIQKLEDGCLILENWTGSQGGTGKSINFFDKDIKKWRQIWVDSSGNSTLFTGEFKDGSMRYEAEKTGPDGKTFLSRLTFTPMDKKNVRQHGERSNDGGKTWVTTFDFVYILKPAERP